MLGKHFFGDTNDDTIRSGNWYGNDTTWRMVLDINRILFHADAKGNLHNRQVRRYLSIVDGIVAGEGNGPLDPTPKQVGIVLAGVNPVAVDLACARLIGFRPDRLPLLQRAFDEHSMPLTSFSADDVELLSNESRYDGLLRCLLGRQLAFEPHFGWRSYIEHGSGERQPNEQRACAE